MKYELDSVMARSVDFDIELMLEYIISKTRNIPVLKRTSKMFEK